MTEKGQSLQEERLKDWLRVHYGLELERMEPRGRAWKLFTDQGEYCLKEVSKKGKEQWDLVADVARHLSQKRGSGLRLAEPVPTQSNKRTFAGYRCRYVLLPWVDGEEASLQTREDWHAWSRKIALFHQATKDFPSASARCAHLSMGSWHDRWQQHLHHLEIGHLAAEWTSFPTLSDRETQQSATYAKGIIHNLLEYDRNIEGEAVRQETAKYSKICHRRLHRHHLIQSKKGTAYLVDPSQMASDVRTTDLARWIIHAHVQTGSPEVLSAILDGYQAVGQPLLKEEYALIYAHLLFPEKYCRLLEQIYIQQSVPIGEAAAAIRQATEREKRKIPLLRQFADVVKRDYGVTIPRVEWIHR